MNLFPHQQSYYHCREKKRRICGNKLFLSEPDINEPKNSISDPLDVYDLLSQAYLMRKRLEQKTSNNLFK